MCDPGEKVSVTLKREFMEEATDCLGKNQTDRKRIEEHLNAFFEKGTEVLKLIFLQKLIQNFSKGHLVLIKIYRGYVDDPRNTDNSWMETIAFNFHDEDDSVFKNFALTAGDDAGSVTWMDISSGLNLYASHKNFVENTAKLLKAHW